MQSGRDGGGMSVDESGAVPNDDVTRAPSAPTGSTDPGPWAVAMADLTVELHASFTDLDATIAAVAASAVKILPGVTAAGVVRIGKDGVLTCQTASNPQVLQMVQAEHRTGQGPCRHVLDPANPAKIVVDNSSGDQRWPQYTAESLSIGIAAVMAVRLESGDAAGQALLLVTDTLLSRSVIDGVDVFAAHAAVAAAQTRTRTELLGAVQTRDVIGQAKGILMERHKMTSSKAFALLVKTSQNTNIPLRQIADQIADTGENPTSQQPS